MTQTTAIAISLKTLDELKRFWNDHGNTFPFAARSALGTDYNWVFGVSKEAVVDLALQWESWNVNCKWRRATSDEYEGADVDPSCEFGFWEFTNLPFGIEYYEWFDVEPPDITDPHLSTSEVMKIFKLQTFDIWSFGFPVLFMTQDGVVEEIEYWEQERAAGEDYYGSENEDIGINNLEDEPLRLDRNGTSPSKSTL